MATVNFSGEIISITPFERVNTHVQLQWPERFVAIAFRTPSGEVYVTFTRKHSEFAESAKIGETGNFSGKFKREQNHANLGGQIVLTNMVRGQYAYQSAAEKRKEKILARAKKLGLA